MTWRRPLFLALAVPLGLVLGLFLFLLWVATQPHGLRFAAHWLEIAAAPGLVIEAPSGTLRGPLHIPRISYGTPARRVVLEDIKLQWQPERLIDGLLFIDRLDIGSLQVVSHPSTERSEPPSALALPLAVRVEQFNILRADFANSAKDQAGLEITGIGGRFVSDGRQHHLEVLRFATSRLAIEASGQVGGVSPFPISARAHVTGEESCHLFTVALEAEGTLSDLAVKAQSTSGTLRVQGKARLDALAPHLVQGTLSATGLNPAAWVAGAPHARLQVEAAFRPQAENPGHFQGRISAINADSGRIDEGRMPLRQLEAEIRQEGQGLQVPAFSARLVVGDIAGKADWASPNLAVAAHLSGVDASTWHKTLPRSRINAAIDGQGRLGAPPIANLHFTLSESRVAGHPLTGQGKMRLEPERLEQAEFILRAGDNRIEARGQLGRPGDILALTIAAPRLEQIGLGGAIKGKASLSGRLNAPSAQWRLTAPQLVLPGGRELRELDSQGQWDAGKGSIQANLSIAHLSLGSELPPLDKVSIGIEGERSRHRLRARARVGETQAIEVAGSGSLDPKRIWQGRIEALEWQGANSFRLASPSRLEAGFERLTLDQAAIVGTDWQAHIDSLHWTPERLQSAGRFNGVPVAGFLPGVAPASTLRLGGEWNIDFGQHTDGKFQLFRQSGDLALEAGKENFSLGLQRLDLSVNFSGQQAGLVLQADGSRAGTLKGQLSASLSREHGRWGLARNTSWQGHGRLDTPSLAWLSPLAGENVRLGGRLQGDLVLGGTPAVPVITGQVSGSGLRIHLLDYGLDLGGGNLRLNFTPEMARLEQLELLSVATQRPREKSIDFARLTAQAGRLSAAGEIALQSGAGRIRLRADKLAVSQLPERWVMVSGTGGVQFTEGHLALNGDLDIDAASIELLPLGRPTLSSDVVMIGRQEKARPGPQLALDLRINLGDHFYFRGSGINSRLAGELGLKAERRDQLRASGSVRTVAGTFDAYGRELAIERGILNFQGLVDNPGLNVLALRKNLAVEAGVEVSGTLKEPQVRLVSVPEVPDTEKLSWMILGRPPGENLGAQDADLLLSAAMALRGNQSRGPLQSLMQGLGLDQLSLSPGTLGERGRFPAAHVAGSFSPGGSTAAEQIATVGKRIGSNAVLSYERSIASTESILKLTVDITHRLAIVGRVGANNAISLIYSFAFGGNGK